MKRLRLILGDQLNYKHSWFKDVESETTYLIIELRQESEYVRHHVQKIIGFFAAMHNFVVFLRKRGHKVIYLRINDPENKNTLEENLNFQISQHGFTHFEYMLPDEYRLDAQLKEFCKNLNVPFKVYDTEHFYTSRDELARFFDGKKTFLLENYYKYLRRKHNILMEGDQPRGGKWNFDAQNRNSYKGEMKLPEPMIFAHDYTDIFEEIRKSGVFFFGEDMSDKFPWPTSRKQSLELMHYFNRRFLPLFGKYQDAMHMSSWNMCHSRLSFSMNTKMISPHEVIISAIQEWEDRKDEIGIEQIEGYVRQILGWREYMRGIYWNKMPGYGNLNYFGHQNNLPQWFWNANTRMNCMKHAINQSLQYAYAHHIQRLMVTGNFALLAGVHPDKVDAWYLGIYMDAIEWVEITNTRGMSQYADGGIVGTKPYVSSASYINKMSNYCKTCYYSSTLKTGERSCPFNSLYWHFYHRHRTLLQNNPRIGMMYVIWDKMDAVQRQAILEQAEQYLNTINEL